jgi:hypothetical protein
MGRGRRLDVTVPGRAVDQAQDRTLSGQLLSFDVKLLTKRVIATLTRPYRGRAYDPVVDAKNRWPLTAES